MKVKKNGINGVFRMFVGDGTYNDRKFELYVTTTPTGDITGMPIVRFLNDGGGKSEVVFELKDIIPVAARAVGNGNRVEADE